MSSPPPAGPGPAAPSPADGAPAPGAPGSPSQGPGAPSAGEPSDAAPGAPAPSGGEDQAGEEESHTVGSGRAATSATSRHGQGSQRSEYLQEAEKLTVHGDSVAGNKNVYFIGGPNQRTRLRRLPARLVRPIRYAFVAPTGFDALRAACEKNRVMILRGPGGCGKQGTAIRLLIDLSAGPLFHLDSEVDLSRLAESIETDIKGRDRIEQGAGFLLNQPRDFADMHCSVLQGLEEALERAEARLILTLGSDVPVPDPDLFNYISDLTSMPRYTEIFASQLMFRLSRYVADDLLSRADVTDLLAQQLGSDPSCRLAAELAEAVADEANLVGAGNDFDLEKVKAWKTRRTAEDFDIWYADLGDLQTRCFAIALAVLNGLPYNTVARGARALYRKFEFPSSIVLASSPDPPPDWRRPFRVSRRDWLHRLRADIKQVDVRGPYGSSPAEAVEYKDPDYIPKVLQRAWSDFETQDTLLAWLGELAEDPSEQVKIFAGIALGQLTAWSFDFLAVRVLAFWAASKREELRDAVAYALRVVAAEPRLRENVRNMVAGWYANRDNPITQATAARAYGVAFGPIDRRKAFEDLDRLSVVPDIRVSIAIGDSMADLLAAGNTDFASFALERLAISVKIRDRSATAQLAFLILADGLVIRLPSPDGHTVAWPTLLHLTRHVTGVRSSIVTLWQHVLNEALFHQEAELVMTRWASAAEGEPDVREAFLRLARAIAHGNARSRMILNRYSALWVTTDNLRPLPVVSAALRAVLG